MVQYMMMGELVETPKQILRMLHIAFGRVWEGAPHLNAVNFLSYAL
jgi:hypothetical protein